jgi:hypothetical protein
VLYKKEGTPHKGTSIRYDDVEAVVVRENKGRQSDNAALAQIYLLLSFVDRPILIHQHYLRRRGEVIQTARRLANELGADLRLELTDGERLTL